MARWPRDNQAALIAFYGDPGRDEVVEQLVKVTPPFKMYFDGRQLRTLSFHKKAAPALLAALEKVWNYYGRNQKIIDELGISKTAGTYNRRKVRGSNTKWSNHAFGAAIDINAEENGFNVAGNIPIPMIAAFKSEGFRWGGDYKGRKDPMHFEACDSGEPARTFDQWLKVLGGEPRKVVKPKPEPEEDFEPTPVPIPPVAPPPIVIPAPDRIPPPTTLPKPPPETLVQGDPELWHIQRRLKAMMYNPGGIDGAWGTLTIGAIAAFAADRGMSLPPLKIDNFATFRAIQDSLKDELSKAEAEGFTRRFTPGREQATAEELAPKLPEVDASAKAERLGFWGSIAAAASAIITGVSKAIGDAVEWLNPLKALVGDVPWQLWVGGALLISGALYYISRKSGDAKKASVEAFRSGERT